jgi:hypothetical protein
MTLVHGRNGVYYSVVEILDADNPDSGEVHYRGARMRYQLRDKYATIQFLVHRAKKREYLLNISS